MVILVGAFLGLSVSLKADLILADLPDPKYISLARLYSVEFFRPAKNRLAPGACSPLKQPARSLRRRPSGPCKKTCPRPSPINSPTTSKTRNFSNTTSTDENSGGRVNFSTPLPNLPLRTPLSVS